jgi:N-dimethylarginine dimethylaminohydrolase
MRAHLLDVLALAACVTLWGTGLTERRPDVALRQTWIVHYQPDRHPLGVTAYADLLRQLPAEDRLLVVVSDGAHGARFQKELANDGRIGVTVSPDPLTPWARDRYLLFSRGGEQVCLSRPSGEVPADQRGDSMVPAALAASDPSIVLVESPLAPIGGDTILTTDHVLIGETSLADALARSGASRESVLREYERLFGRRPAIVATSALGIERIHIDLFVAWASGRTMLVADPALASDLLEGGAFQDPRYGTFLASRNAQFKRGLDKAAARLRVLGYEVHRVPGLIGEPHGPFHQPTVLSYTNCVVEGKRAYLPAYGLAALDARAQGVWSSLGFAPAPVACSASIQSGGAVRCLTNRVQ